MESSGRSSSATSAKPSRTRWSAWNGPSEEGDGDYDQDGLTNGQEYEEGTDPTETDSDHDGIRDEVEVDRGSDPLDPASQPTGVSSDGDGGLADPTAPEKDKSEDEGSGVPGFGSALLLGAMGAVILAVMVARRRRWA